MTGTPPGDTRINLCEIYPGVTWFDLTLLCRDAAEVRATRAKQVRIALLEQFGVHVPLDDRLALMRTTSSMRGSGCGCLRRARHPASLW